MRSVQPPRAVAPATVAAAPSQPAPPSSDPRAGRPLPHATDCVRNRRYLLPAVNGWHTLGPNIEALRKWSGPASRSVVAPPHVADRFG